MKPPGPDPEEDIYCKTFRELDGQMLPDGSEQPVPDKTLIYDSARLARELASMDISMDSHGCGSTEDTILLRSVDGSFILRELIGKGGQGDVYEAIQRDLGRVVAVKRAGDHPMIKRDFLREAFTAARLDHPNIVPIYDIGMIDGGESGPAPVIAMKRVRGQSWLEMTLHDRGAPGFTLDTFLSKHLPILIDVLNALAYAHSKNIIHRDLKPQQVMVGKFGEVFLLDWGLAVYLGEEIAKDSVAPVSLPNDTRLFTLATTSNPAGTPAYMAPEQTLDDPRRLGKHTDIYLIGAIIYELLTGRPPHPRADLLRALEIARRNEIDPIPAGAPRDLVDLAMRCMSTESVDRPDTVEEIRDELQAFVTGAGRKEESVRLTAALASRPEITDYPQLSEASRDLSQATHLWPENPAVPALRDKVLAAFVTVALRRRDFLLAQLQADRIADADKKARLFAEIEKERTAAENALPRPSLLTIPRLACLLTINAAIIAAMIWIVGAARETLMTEVSDKVMSLALIAAKEVDPDDLRAVDRDNDIYTPEFQRVLTRLDYYRQQNSDIRFIYTFRPEREMGPAAWRVLVDADPEDLDADSDGEIDNEEEGNPPGSIYEDGTPEMLVSFDEKTTTSGIANDAWGTFVSGYAPVLDKETDEAVAIVGVDIKMDVVNNKLNRLYTAAGLGTLFLMALVTTAFLAVLASRRALGMVRLLENEIRKQSTEIRGKDLSLG